MKAAVCASVRHAATLDLTNLVAKSFSVNMESASNECYRGISFTFGAALGGLIAMAGGFVRPRYSSRQVS
jgi:hypothetical protein